MRGSATLRPVTALAALLLAAAGCTICPDPFDYSGPVPDGSAPQNDFQARANGILPIGSHPIPWPPVVQAAPRFDATARPTVAAAEPETHVSAEIESARADEPAVAGGTEAELDVDSIAVQPVAAESAVTPPVAAAPRPVAVTAEPDMNAVPARPVLEAILPPPARPRSEIVPPLRETPGWKPRG
ncbi:MAG: hypothetical protein ACKOSQ_11060 [Planctomycetaceae bacterium]